MSRAHANRTPIGAAGQVSRWVSLHVGIVGGTLAQSHIIVSMLCIPLAVLDRIPIELLRVEVADTLGGLAVIHHQVDMPGDC